MLNLLRRPAFAAAALALALAAGGTARAAGYGTNPTAALEFAHSGYAAGRWYQPLGTPASSGTAATPGTNTAVCTFGYIAKAITIDNLGARVNTLEAAKNFQLAVYNNGTWGRPSTLIAATANISGATTGAKTAAASGALAPGGYWFCFNSDFTTGVMQSYSNTMVAGAATMGSTAAADVLGSGALVMGYTVAQTLGTWPTWTSGTSWTAATTNIVPFMAFSVASVP